MFDICSIFQRAHDFGDKMHEIHDLISQIRAKGSAAGGMVVVEINGIQDMVSCKIDHALFKNGDHELLEELIIAATNEAVAESRNKQNEILQPLTGETNDSPITEVLEQMLKK
jgi:DNA-binding YbaB/EbfC family protein